MNYAILLSGGTGSRIGSDIPKQYVKAGSHMMITYALKALAESRKIDRIYIVADNDRRASISEDAAMAGLDSGKIAGFADPGENRQCSVLNGMKEFIGSATDEDTVLIHDAARPFVSTELLKDIYEALCGNDGVMPVLPMKDTVYHSEDGRSVSGLLDRQKIYAGQAPELFLLKKYYDANIALVPDKILEINGASEPAIKAGMNIAMIPGDEKNFKVTSSSDLDRFITLAKEM